MDSGRRKVKDLLEDALAHLAKQEIKMFKSKLRDIFAPGKNNIPRGRLEGADNLDLVEFLIEFYEEQAPTIMIDILEKMGFRRTASNLSQELKDQVQSYQKKYAKNVMDKYLVTEERNSQCGESIPLNACCAELLSIRKHQTQEQRKDELTATGRFHMEILKIDSMDYITTDIESLFECDAAGKIPKTVVLQGPPGFGKTMTVQKIMLEWAAGKLNPPMFDYVFCICCRELSLPGKTCSLADLIIEQCQDKCAPVQEILAHPEKLLFIIDGFDEISIFLESTEGNFCDNPNLKVPLEHILSSLLRKTLMSESFLLIATRPGAMERLEQCLKLPRFTEIVGFSEKGRREYFFQFFKDEQKANIALRFIENTVAVSTICFLPMVCWIICSMIKVDLETEDEIADSLDTTTKVFAQFCYTLLNRDRAKWKTSPLHEFRKLCSLARAGVMQQKIFFEEQDLKEHNLDISPIKDLFLDRRPFMTGMGQHNSYSFFHLCFQEFFAAVWYMLQDKSTEKMGNNIEDLERFLVEWDKPGNEHFAQTVCFIFGLTSEKMCLFFKQTLQCKTCDLVKPLLLQKIQEMAAKKCHWKDRCLLNFFHCLFECQEPEFAKSMMDHFQIIDLSYKTLSVLDCRVLTFCLQHSTIEEHSLDLTSCRLKLHHIRALAPGIKNCTTLKLGWNKLGDLGVKVLCAILKELGCNLTTLELNRNYLTDICAQELCAVLRTSLTLNSLCLEDNSFRDASIPFIQDLMKNCTSLTVINSPILRSREEEILKTGFQGLSSNGFDDRGQKHLKHQGKRIIESGQFTFAEEELLSMSALVPKSHKSLPKMKFYPFQLFIRMKNIHPIMIYYTQHHWVSQSPWTWSKRCCPGTRNSNKKT